MDQTIEDSVKNIRLQAMKIKYYDLVVAFKEYEKNQSKENAILFIRAAENLAEDDVTDILFNTDLFINEKYIKETVEKLNLETITQSKYSDSLNEIDYEYIER